MTGPESLEDRVVRLEQEVTRLRERVAATSGDAAAARVLAGGADRDVAEIRTEIREEMRGHTQALNALGETRAGYSAQLADLGRRLTALEERVDSLEETMRAGFAEMRSGMGQIVTLLGGAPPA